VQLHVTLLDGEEVLPSNWRSQKMKGRGGDFRVAEPLFGAHWEFEVVVQPLVDGGGLFLLVDLVLRPFVPRTVVVMAETVDTVCVIPAYDC
jgi:hypothetical protein